MRAYGRRYLAVRLGSIIGPAFVMAFFFGPLPFVIYIAVYLVAYDNSPRLHRAIDRIARGKEEKT